MKHARKFVSLILVIFLCAFSPRIKSPILLISIPKCGTYLLMRTLEMISSSPCLDWCEGQYTLKNQQLDSMTGTIFAGHVMYHEQNLKIIEERKFKPLFIIRDPRDQIVSMMYWIYKHPYTATKFKDVPQERLLEQLIVDPVAIYPPESIELQGVKGIAEFYELFVPWINHPSVYTIRFEDLVGKHGGGSEIKQKEELKAIASHINLNIPAFEFDYLPRRIFGNTLTFRKGQIGEWKTHFNEQHKKLFKKIAGQLLIDLGYEKDFNW